MEAIALSMPLTTLPIDDVTFFIVTAVCTRDATPSMRDDSRSRLSDSFLQRMAFAAYMRAPSVFPCCSALLRRAYLLELGLFGGLVLGALLALSAQLLGSKLS